MNASIVLLALLLSFTAVSAFTTPLSALNVPGHQAAPNVMHGSLPLSPFPLNSERTFRQSSSPSGSRALQKVSMGLLDDIAEKLERDVSLQTTSSFAKPGTPVMVLFEGKVTKRDGEEGCGKWRQGTLLKYDANKAMFTVKLQDGNTVQGLVPGIKGHPYQEENQMERSWHQPLDITRSITCITRSITCESSWPVLTQGIGGDDGFIPDPSGAKGVFIREKNAEKDRLFYLSVLPQFLFGVVPFLILLSPAITYPLKKLFNWE